MGRGMEVGLTTFQGQCPQLENGKLQGKGNYGSTEIRKDKKGGQDTDSSLRYLIPGKIQLFHLTAQ